MKRLFHICIFSILSPIYLWSQSVFEDTSLIKSEGFFNTYYAEQADKLYMEVVELDSAFLYVSALSEGVGHNDLFLDRGQIGGTRIVKFKKAGNKLMLIQPNLRYRAITANELEKKSVEEAFAKSVLFGFPIIEKTKNGYLIDLTPFLMQDTHGVKKILKLTEQGTYGIDLSKSALNMERTKSFPKNVDFDVLITLKGSPESFEISSVTPNPNYITVYQHHSFVELPDANFKPRVAHPNSGAITTTFINYSSPIGDAMEVNYCWKHRLEKKDPNAPISEAKEPIIYYLDNGTPEPIRSALLDGASWWNEAFEASGYKDAFQVKILPDTIDPLDVRYNVIQWVHRSTRGWSYGGGVVDPRTGEIIKGHVSLGSLRVRQDYMIAQALLKDPFGNGKDESDKMLAFALARIRQLSAHEVGHTLGFSHNFAASLNDRASVMDYPHPLVTLNNGAIDISNAYAVGIGEWDKISVAYSYAEFNSDEEKELKNIINQSMDSGFRYVSDADARPMGSSNAYGHLWDNGSDIIEELENVLAIRKQAMDQFGVNNIKDGDSFDDLEDLFVLIYYYHRYQTEAVTKLVAGLEYGYSLKGEVEFPTKPVTVSEQRKALEAVLLTLDSEFLIIPDTTLIMFPARGEWDRGRESFATLTGSAFDPLSAAATASNNTLMVLLNHERVNRLISQHVLNPNQLGLEETLDRLIEGSLMKTIEENYKGQIQWMINNVVLTRLMSLAQSDLVYFQVKAQINKKLMTYRDQLKNLKHPTLYQDEHIQVIDQYFSNPQRLPVDHVPQIPDGSPIGTNACSQG